MQHCEAMNIELENAKSAIEEMRTAKNLDEFEKNWKSFLVCLERVWNKAYSHFNKSPKWNGWKGEFEKLRKTDPLLSYLKNARDAYEHTVSEITSREPGRIGINAADGSSLYIERMEVKNGNISINTQQKIRIDFIPAKIKPSPVINRNRTYDVPRTHLGKPIDPDDVISIAEAGAQFYQEFLKKAENFFVK